MKDFFNKLTNANGFSIVQITVAAGILGALTLGVSKMVQQMGKSSKKANQDLEVSYITNEIISTLGNQVACANTFTGIVPAAAIPNPEMPSGIIIRNSANNEVFKENEKYGHANKVRISAINMYSYNDVTKRALISVQIVKDVSAVDAEGLNTIGSLQSSIRIPVRVSASPSVNTCYVDREDVAEAICQTNFNGTYAIDDDFKCHSIKIRNSGAAALTVATGSVALSDNDSSEITNPAGGNIDIAGSVGIGTKRSNGTGNIGLSGSIGAGTFDAVGLGNVFTSGGVSVGDDYAVGNGVLQTKNDLVVNRGLSIGTTTSPNAQEMISAKNIVINGLLDTDSNGTYVATLEWVKTRIAYTLVESGGAELVNLGNDIISNAGYNESESGLNVIKKSACTTSTMTSGDGALVVGAWNAAANRCNYNIRHCTTNGVCANVYAISNVQAGGNIITTTGSITAANNITAGGYLNSQNSYVRAGSYVRANTYVLGSQRVCAGSTSTCYTKFHSVLCTGKNVLVGVSNGHFICTNKW